MLKHPGDMSDVMLSEASLPASCETLRFAQGDMVPVKEIGFPNSGQARGAVRG